MEGVPKVGAGVPQPFLWLQRRSKGRCWKEQEGKGWGGVREGGEAPTQEGRTKEWGVGVPSLTE